MRTRVLVSMVLALVVALTATGWAVEKEGEPALAATTDNPAAGASLVTEAPLAAWPGPDGYGYTGQACTYSWIDIAATGTPIVGLADDNFAGPFPIGFSFAYYDSARTDFYVSSNGFLSFGAGNSTLTNQCPLPDAVTPNDVIALLWDDLNFSTSGMAYYQTFATCPVGTGACLVVAFLNTAHYGGAAGSAGTWEAVLYGSGVVRLQYQDPGVETGAQSTTGIENNDAAANFGLTYACNTAASLTANLCLEIGMVPGVRVMPNPLNVVGCAGAPQTHAMSLFNNTGSPGVFDMTYQVTGGDATLGGPPEVAAASGATEPFGIDLTPSGPAGAQTVTATVTAEGNSYSSTANIVKTVYGAGTGIWTAIASEPDTGRMDNVAGTFGGKIWSITGYGANANVRSYDPALDSWTTIAGSAPPFGVNYARSGCTAGSKVFVYGDAGTAGFSGLWSYNMATNIWTNEAPSGTPPAQTGIWAPSWVFDPEAGVCYMTGGATVPGAGDLTTVYAYNALGNAWLAPLPNFTSVRDFHAAFIYRRVGDNHKLLCVAGGTNTAGMSSTQCYDFTAAAWNAENADLGPLPADRWAMGYTDKTGPGGGRQLWLVGGIVAGGSPSTSTVYYDVATGSWQDGGALVTTGVYRNAAATLANEVYHLGGSIGSFTYTGVADRNLVCSAGGSMPFIDGFESGNTSAWSNTVP